MLKISRKAADDLLSIGAYTEKHWGKAQRNRYLDAIDERFRQLAENPDYPTAKDIGAIKPGCFALAVNEHLIIYRKFHYGVRIVRVLGQVIEAEGQCHQTRFLISRQTSRMYRNRD